MDSKWQTRFVIIYRRDSEGSDDVDSEYHLSRRISEPFHSNPLELDVTTNE
jgi:hypothetical protein